MTNEEFSEWTTSDTDELFADFPDEYFEMLFTPVDFDVNNQYLTIRLTPAPSEPVGGGLVGTWYLTQSDIQLTVDSLVVERDDLRTNYFFEAHPKYWIPYGAIDTTLDVNGLAGWSFNNNPFWYPFDSYPFTSQSSWSSDRGPRRRSGRQRQPKTWKGGRQLLPDYARISLSNRGSRSMYVQAHSHCPKRERPGSTRFATTGLMGSRQLTCTPDERLGFECWSASSLSS